jgi:hypothetical protein
MHRPGGAGRSILVLVFLAASVTIMFVGLSTVRDRLGTPSCAAALQRVAAVRGDGWSALKLQLSDLPAHCRFDIRS